MKTLNETARWIGLIGIIDGLHRSQQMLFAMAGGVGRVVAGGFVGVIAISKVRHLCETV